MTPTSPRIPLWIDLRGVPVNKRLSFLKAVADANAEAVLLERGDPHVSKAGLAVVAVGADGQLRRKGKRIGRMLDVHDRASQETAARAKGIVVADGNDWRVIPLENLVAARQAKPGTLFALARTAPQARLFASTLETGVHGVVLAPSTTADIHATDRLLRETHAARCPTRSPTPVGPPVDAEAGPNQGRIAKRPTQLTMMAARIERIADAGLGERVCVDTTSLLREGEGILVGSTARSFVLVQAETVANDLIAARPFRVNAGALHMYALAPGGATRYLSELQAGDSVLVASRDGSTRAVTIGRCKLERRPHTLIHWTSGSTKGSAVLQTAETVCLLRPDGARIAVTSLKVGDEVLVHPETAARHTGVAVEGSLEER